MLTRYELRGLAGSFIARPPLSAVDAAEGDVVRKNTKWGMSVQVEGERLSAQSGKSGPSRVSAIRTLLSGDRFA